MKNWCTILLTFLFSALLLEAFATTWYVDSIAAGGGNGLAWETAFNDLQDALAVYNPGDEIWVAQGTYTPAGPGGDRGAWFLIDRDVILLGGFKGDEMTAAERNPDLYISILSGDLNGDDVADDFENFRSDNSYTVVNIAGPNVSEVTLVDGFTIRGGHADEANGDDRERNGGGMYALRPVTIRNCSFEENYAINSGGAIRISNPVGTDGIIIEDCVFTNNRAEYGGAIRVLSYGFSILKCSFNSNEATVFADEGNWGGAIHITRSIGLIEECNFSGNQAAASGGAIFAWVPLDASTTNDITISDCTFENNGALFEGGAIRLNTLVAETNYVIKGSTFSQNNAGSGGAIVVQSNDEVAEMTLTVDSCTFLHNEASNFDGGAVVAYVGGTDDQYLFSNLIFESNQSALSGALTIWSESETSGTATVENCSFLNNSAAYGAGMELRSISETGSFHFEVSECTFLRNVATVHGGGLSLIGESAADMEVYRCLFKDNSAPLGGGLVIAATAPGFSALIRNSEWTVNDGIDGSAIAVSPTEDLLDPGQTYQASINFENCLLAKNGDTDSHAAFFCTETGAVKLLNCTVADNSSHGVVLDNEALFSMQNTALYNPGFVEFSALGGNETITSNGGNFVFDASWDSYKHPVLDITESSPEFESDTSYSPSPCTSPLINGGVLDGVTAEFDLAGNDRTQGFVDIGAFETDCLVAVREAEVPVQLQLMPNPTVDELKVLWPSTISGSVEVRIFDMQGRLVRVLDCPIYQTVDVWPLRQGTYQIEFVHASKVYRGTFVKM